MGCPKARAILKGIQKADKSVDYDLTFMDETNEEQV
jgi:hypothetical protein